MANRPIHPTPAHLREDETLDIGKVFILALFLGAISIVAGQFFASPLLSISLPLLVMGVYIFLGFYKGAAEPIIEQFADSIYYLGFLFTLLALVASLYAFRAESLSIGRLVSNFALALVTTIVGLSTRIVINNFRGDISGARRRMRDELDQAAADLIRNARAIAMRLEVLDTEMHDSLNSAMDKAASSIAKSSEAVERHAHMGTVALTRVARKVGDSMTRTAEDLQQRVQAVELPDDLFVAKLAEPLDRLVERLEQVHTGLSEISHRQRGVPGGFLRLGHSIEQAAERMETLDHRLDGLDRQLQIDRAARQELARLAGDMTGLADATRAISGEIAKQSAGSREVVAGLQQVVSALAVLPKEIVDTSGDLQRGGAALGRAIASFEEDARAARGIGESVTAIAAAFSDARNGAGQLSAISEQLQGVVAGLQGVVGSIEQQTRALAAMDELASSRLEALRIHQRDMDALLKETRASLAAVNRHFVEAAEYVTERLGD